MPAVNFADILVVSLQRAWGAFIEFLPNFIGALIVFFVGWAIAVGLGKLAEKIIDALRIDTILEKLGFKLVTDRAGLRLDSGAFVGGVVRWFFIIVALLAATDILRLGEVTAFLRQVLAYIPNIVIAVLIMLAALLMANFLHRVVRAAVSAGGFMSGNFLAALTRWAVLVFAFLAALSQLGIAAQLINTVVTGFVAMLAIAFGLAFGLGGKDVAGNFIDRLRKEISER